MGGAPTRPRDCNPCGLSAGPLPRTTTESPCWQLLESYLFSPKNTAGNERSLATGMGVGQIAFLSPFPEQQGFWIFILTLTEEENKLCVAFLQSSAESGYSWLQELRGRLGQYTHWTDGKRSQRSSVHCVESSGRRGALE